MADSRSEHRFEVPRMTSTRWLLVATGACLLLAVIGGGLFLLAFDAVLSRCPGRDCSNYTGTFPGWTTPVEIFGGLLFACGALGFLGCAIVLVTTVIADRRGGPRTRGAR